MGLRSAASASTTNATEMAPALTEPVSHTKISAPTTSASPRPGILTSCNKNGQYLCLSAPQQSTKNSFQLALASKILSNGPSNGPSANTHMEQTNNYQEQHQNLTDKIESPQTSAEQPLTTTVTTSQTTPTSSTQPTNMGLQKDYLKDTVDMEQMLGDLTTTSDIDLLQVFKSFVAPAGENLCELAGGLALFNDVDMNMGLEDVSTPSKEPDTQEVRNDIEKRHTLMLRKCDFLVRRLRKLQARSMGQHANEEINGLFEYTQHMLKRKERESKSISTMSPLNQLQYDKQKHLTSCSMKSIIKRIDEVASNQQTTLQTKPNRTQTTTQPLSEKQNNFAASKTTPTTNLNNLSTAVTNQQNLIPTFDMESSQKLEHTTGLLYTELKCVANAIDSDATASSSGGESADELVTYNNVTQHSLTIAKRAAWRWSRDRAAIASRWTWLLAQISDLEYRIRQHKQLHQQIKDNKGAVTFEDAVTTTVVAGGAGSSQQDPPPQHSVNGYRGLLPGNTKPLDFDTAPNGAMNTTDDSASAAGSCRTRAFNRAGFKKRKLLQTTNLHTISKKAARQSTVKCGCQWPLHPCALCTGRQDPTAPRDLPDMIPFAERVGLLDPGFHPVISFTDDVSHSVHFEATMRQPDFQTKAFRSTSKTALRNALALQKSIERDENRTTKKPTTDSQPPPKKYPKKYNLIASKLKKKAKNSKFKRSYGHLLNYKNGKGITTPSAILTPTSSSTTSLANDLEMGTPNGATLSRSKNTSPTPGSSGNSYRYKDNYGYYSDRNRNRNSYDIDSIVIPYSVAASTRVELLPYKEIPTPKWRIIENEETGENLNTSQNNGDDNESESDSPESIESRHHRALDDERKKFSTFLKFPWSTRSRANRRINSRADSSGANTPDPTSPAPPLKTPSVAGDQESIPPSPTEPSTPLQSDSDNVNDGNATPIINVTPSGPSNGNLMGGLRAAERRRTVSMKKISESKDDLFRQNFPTDIKDIPPPYDRLEFPLNDELFETMIKTMPTNHQTIIDNCLEKALHEIEIENENKPAVETFSTTPIPQHYINEITIHNLSAISAGDSDTESVESGLMEDPNDPEWCEPPART